MYISTQASLTTTNDLLFFWGGVQGKKKKKKVVKSMLDDGTDSLATKAEQNKEICILSDVKQPAVF